MAKNWHTPQTLEKTWAIDKAAEFKLRNNLHG